MGLGVFVVRTVGVVKRGGSSIFPYTEKALQKRKKGLITLYCVGSRNLLPERFNFPFGVAAGGTSILLNKFVGD